MNILFLIGKYPNFGGTEKVTTMLANEFAKMGWNVHIASFDQPHMDLISELSEDVKFHKLHHGVLVPVNICILRNIIIQSQINVLINQWCLPFSTNILCNLARLGTTCKLLSVLHGVPNKSKRIIVAQDRIKKEKKFPIRVYRKAEYFLINKVIQMSIRYVYSFSDKYIVLSKGFVKDLQEYANLKNICRVVAIGNPLTIPVDYNVQIESEKKKQILYVGRMDKENKRVNRIVEAWEYLYEKFPDWSMVLVGDGPHLNELKEYVINKDIQNITFTGFLKEEPIKYYKESSILLLTSDLEGFGLVIIEGMAYGVVPIVYGSYSTVYDIIDSGKNGFITPQPYSKEATVICMKRLMENEALRKKMSNQAIIASKAYSIDNVIQNWLKIV